MLILQNVVLGKDNPGKNYQGPIQNYILSKVDLSDLTWKGRKGRKERPVLHLQNSLSWKQPGPAGAAEPAQNWVRKIYKIT